MTPKKTMTLPFIQEGVSQDLITSLTVDVQARQTCEDCGRKNSRVDDAHGWILIIEARKGDFASLYSHIYCAECGRQRLAHYNRVKECSAEFGHPAPHTPDDKRVDACIGRKSEVEEASEIEHDDGEFDD
jgi:hypothetical protein